MATNPAATPSTGETQRPLLIEERLKLAMESTRLTWWDWDLRTGEIAIYGSDVCLLGYAIDTLPRSGSEWFDYVHPDERPGAFKAVEDCLAGKAVFWSLDHRIRAADGTWRWVTTSGRVAEPDDRGQPTRMVGVTRDIHDKRVAEDEVRRDALILAQLQDIVLYCDPNYIIQYANDSFTRVLGIPKTDAIGKAITFRFPERMQDEVMDYAARVLRGQSLEVEFEDVRADGSRVWIHWRAQPVFGPNGQLTGIINIGTDIDARKRGELQRRDIERQLIESQRMETLGALAGGIAHDFNNILSAIYGFTELALARGTGDDQARHTHRQVLKAAERARDLVKRILSFSRFHEVERRAVSPREVVEDAARFIRAALPSTIEIDVNVKDECPPTLLDPHQIHQVLLNLATNAAHAIGENHGELKLTLLRERLPQSRNCATGTIPGGDYLVIEAADNGCGISPATMPRIFDAFFTTKKEGEGTGLGLAVVSAIVRGHSGGIDVTSSVGVGTRFRIFLPIIPGVQLPSINPDEAFAPRLRARGENIAVIDDEATVALAVDRVLQSFGYRTSTYESGSKFLELFAVAPSGIDLIVSDQTMPGMTGIEMAIRLREQGCEIPVLLMTGFSKQLRPELVSAVGNAALLKKPFTRLDLAKAVRELLDADLV